MHRKNQGWVLHSKQVHTFNIHRTIIHTIHRCVLLELFLCFLSIVFLTNLYKQDRVLYLKPALCYVFKDTRTMTVLVGKDKSLLENEARSNTQT